MRHSILTVLLGIVVLTACEHAIDDNDPGGLLPTLSSIQANIFNANCALSGCHVGPAAPLGLDLSAGSAYSNLIGVASVGRPDLLRVKPGDSDASYLVMKLEGASGIVGARMPLGRPPLSSAEIGVIRTWIDEGAAPH